MILIWTIMIATVRPNANGNHISDEEDKQKVEERSKWVQVGAGACTRAISCTQGSSHLV